MPECPNCERGFKGTACNRCGWTSGPAQHQDGVRRWAWKTECEWMTNGRRCLIRPSASLDGGRQYCSWHHAVSLMGSARVAEHFESYEAYVMEIEDRNACAMEGHYPARITFAWACGEPVSAKPSPCASVTCAVRLREQESAPLAPLTANQGRKMIAEILEHLGGKFTLPEVDPAIREKPQGAPR